MTRKRTIRKTKSKTQSQRRSKRSLSPKQKTIKISQLKQNLLPTKINSLHQNQMMTIWILAGSYTPPRKRDHKSKWRKRK
jgi:hypothetical protein